MSADPAIRFTKAHGAGNDFLLTWAGDMSADCDLPVLARAICNRHTGMGADGWILMEGASLRLYNADGSKAEISGNGTRCAAALLVDSGLAADDLTIVTEAGPKRLLLLERNGRRFLFEMDMGPPKVREESIRFQLPLSAGPREVTILDVGNPQCAVFVDDFSLDWRALGAEIEGHAQFPRRTNVSFVRVVDSNTIDVRFYERGVGETQSSGTGSTGAAVAAILRKCAASPLRVMTPAADLKVRWDHSVYLTGPAEITGAGEFYFSESMPI